MINITPPLRPVLCILVQRHGDTVSHSSDPDQITLEMKSIVARAGHCWMLNAEQK
jgi:hypothetical protein